MSVTIADVRHDAKIGRIYLRRDGEANVRLEIEGDPTYVPIRSLIEAVEAMARPGSPLSSRRVAVVRDEVGHRMGSSWYMKECSVYPAAAGRVKIGWSRVRGTVEATVRAKKLLKILRSYDPAPPPEEEKS